jgi:tetratricopeptide (TPR) repeat protein
MQRLSWKSFLVRWLVILVGAVAACALTFFACQWLMPPALAWAGTRAAFEGGPDLVKRLNDFGPAGVASLLFLGVVAVGRGWADAARPPSRDDQPTSVPQQSAPVAEQVVFGAIPREAWCFQPRPVEQIQLHQALAAGSGKPGLLALSGARGVGKSQLAAAYARECVDGGYRLVAWINAESGPVTGLAQLAVQMGLGNGGELSPEQLADRMQLALLRRDGAKRLIVFDNVEDPAVVVGFLSATGTAEVIITSNRQEFSTMAGIRSILVESYIPEKGRAFLAEATGLPDDTDSAETGAQLSWLPLGLAQAAAYIRHNRLSYRQYLTALTRQDLDEALTQHAGADHVGVLRATALSMAGLYRDDPTGASARLLTILSLLSADGVSRSTLTSEAAHAVLGIDATGVARALRTLAAASLITITFGASQSGGGQDLAVIALHRLTARVIRHQVNQSPFPPLNDVVTTATELLHTLTDVLPLAQIAHRRSEFDELIAHITALYEHAPKPQAELLELLSWTGSALQAAGDLTRAVPMLLATLADRERLLGADHPNTLSSRNDLAFAYRLAGRLGEAIALHEATLADRERVLGTDHPDTLTSRNNLAFAYRWTGRLGEAITLHEATLADRERILGADHPKTLISRSNLATAYRLAGRLGEAITLHQVTLADCERVLGTDHPTTLTCRTTLAFAYLSADQLDEAITLYQATLADRQRILGIDHPNTLSTRNDLANAYRSADRLGEAITLHEATLADRERVLGTEHPDTLTCRNDLAFAYLSAGRLDEAITLYQATLADCERLLSTEHTVTRTVRERLSQALGVRDGTPDNS